MHINHRSAVHENGLMPTIKTKTTTSVIQDASIHTKEFINNHDNGERILKTLTIYALNLYSPKEQQATPKIKNSKSRTKTREKMQSST